MDVLWISDTDSAVVKTTPYKQALNKLGQETDIVVFDLTQTLQVNALGAISGCIRGGGAIVFLLPENDSHYQHSVFYQRMLRVLLDHKISILTVKDDVHNLLPSRQLSPKSESNSNSAHVPTTDQAIVIEAVKKVVTGHRNRPLVLTSDRGRGKSSAIGMAIKSLLLERPIKIIVCAPAKAMVAPLLQCAGKHQNLYYLAVDELVKDLPDAGLVVIDEAGAIPVPLLGMLLQHYSRLVFSTTLQGYEGNGRGFAIRFNTHLNQLTPNWRAVELNKPIRWKQNDPLELLIDDLLLLNAQSVESDQPLRVSVDTLDYKKLNAADLLKDEPLLRELFGLLVVAHYQTRPSDLLQILDASHLSIHALFITGRLIATAIVSHEGGLNEALANAIYRGERRPKGHLVPQILLSQMGIIKASTLTTDRIMRIATLPSARRQGAARQLLNQLKINSQADYLSTSFGLSQDLLTFWQASQYSPLYVGLKREASSGYHSAVLLRPLSKNGWALKAAAVKSSTRNFIAQLGDGLKDFDPTLALQLLRSSSQKNADLCQQEIRDIKRFMKGQCGLDCALAALQQWLPAALAAGVHNINNNEAELLVMRILQHHTWAHCCERLGIASRQRALQQLQQTVSALAEKLPEADLSKEGLTRN